MADIQYNPATGQPMNQDTQEPEVGDPYEKRAKKALDEYEVSMQALQSMMPQIDYDKVFAPYMQKAKDQPTMKMPGRMESFARAFGSEGGNESVLGQISQSHAEKREKSAKLLDTERRILEAKVNQELQSGNASAALKTHHAQKLLEYQLDAINDEREAKTKTDAEDQKQRNREKLLSQKQTGAVNLAKEKINAMVKLKGGDDKMALAAFNWFMRTNNNALLSILNADPVLGGAVSPETTQQLTAMVQQSMQDYLDNYHKASPAPEGDGGGQEGKKSRAREIADRKMKERSASK